MAQKRILVEGVGEVVLQKRRGTRSLRLTVTHDGVIRVSMPPWAPYRVAESFAQGKVAWLQDQLKERHVVSFRAGDRIGKAHRLRFESEDRESIRTLVRPTEIIVRLPLGTAATSNEAQSAIKKAAVRALRQEAKQLLPKRLEVLATTHGFAYRSVAVKPLKSRWGSCSSERDIILNCYLMQLPWELIDYVLLHELTHTRVLAHGPRFWDEMAQVLPRLAAHRKDIKRYQPTLLAA